MILTGVIERFQFSPTLYYQQSRLMYWIRTVDGSQVVMLEDMGTAAELARKYNLPAVDSKSLSTIIGKKCHISISKGIKQFRKFLN